MLVLLPTLAGLTLAQLPPTGTQPGDLRDLPDTPAACSCHYNPQPGVVVEPGQTHNATTMALAARDPLFQAAFVIARQDRPQLSPLCIRCHAPRGWLGGRGQSDLQALAEDDLHGISCDVCHRMALETPPLIGDAQLTLTQSTAKRSRRGSSPFGGHAIQRTDDLLQSESCGVCHSLFNPTEEAHDHLGRGLGINYYEQRTYEEWIGSVYPSQDRGCVSCHMRQTQGQAADNGPIYDDLWVHDIVGGNTIVAEALSIMEPELSIAGLVPSLKRRVEQSLQDAVELEVLSSPLEAIEAGKSFQLQVRITNKTGHKLPTGYPEGRRVYLEVSFLQPGQPDPEVVIGAWDPTTGDLISHPQLVTYETIHGRVEGGISRPTRHLLLMNQVILDTRIPPEGFIPPFEDMHPVGRDFGLAPPYRHFDEPSFELIAPNTQTPSTPITIRVRAMYQVAYGASVDFLLDETVGTSEGSALARAWDIVDKAPPQEMARVDIQATLVPTEPEEPEPGPNVNPTSPSDALGCTTSPHRTQIFLDLIVIAFFVGILGAQKGRRHLKT